MAILIPPKPHASASSSVMRMFRLLRKLGNDFTVRHLLDALDGPQFFVIWRDRHAFLIRVAATSQELADTALSPMFLPDSQAFRIEDLDAPKTFGHISPDTPVRLLVVFPNVESSTIDQIERLRSEDSGVTFLGLKQSPPERFACQLEALAEPPLSQPMLLALRERFDAGSRIHTGATPRRIPLLQRGTGDLPPAFLDLDQETLAKLDIALPSETARLTSRFETRLVTGPAGCGKSLVLLHRALFAARLNRRSRLLILTHNRPINGELRSRALATAPEGARIQWLTFYQWAARHLPARPERILSQRETLRRIETLIDSRLGRLTPAFIAEEIGYLRDLGIGSLDAYLSLERNGRLMALTSPRREAVWRLLETYRMTLRQHRETDWHEMALEFRNFALLHPDQLRTHDFVFIDEAQFFAKVWFEPVLAALRPGGQLFLAADPTQGFLKRRDSWLAAGIDIRGRSNRLSTPYRSTRSILRFARDLILQRRPLHSDADDDLDPPTDEDLAAIPDEGEPPVQLHVPSAQDAISRVTREISSLRDRSPHLAGNVLVLHADSFATGSLVSALRIGLGAPHVRDLNSRDPQPEHPFCSVSNCMAATGLEAAVVFLLGTDHLLESEADTRLDEAARAELASGHTRLLYMACTRAARRLVILSNHRLHETQATPSSRSKLP